MTAYQKLPLAQNIRSASPFHGLRTRDALDEAAVQLRARITQFDDLLARYQGRLESLDGLPDDLKSQLESRAKEIKDLSGQVEELQQKLVEDVQNRNTPNPHELVSALIRNKDAVEYAKMMHARSGNKKDAVVFEGLNARNVITLGTMPANATFAQNDIQASVRAMPLSVIDLINWGTTSDPVSYYLRESTFEIMADIAPENTDKKESNFSFGITQLNVGTIAHWIRTSKQVLSDMPLLANYLETRMAYGVRYKLEYYVVNGHTPDRVNKKSSVVYLKQITIKKLNQKML